MNFSELLELRFTLDEDDVMLTSHPKILVVSAVFLVLMTTFAILSNVTVTKALIVSLLTDRKRVTSGQNEITKYLITSLAVSDALLAILVMPFGIIEVVHNGKWVLGLRACIFKYCSDYILSGVSFFIVFFMALDWHPLRYRLLSHKHAYVMIFVSWIIPCFCLTSWFIADAYQLNDSLKLINQCIIYNITTEFFISFIVAYILPFLMMYLLYLLIIRKLDKIKKPFGLRMKGKLSGQAVTGVQFENNGLCQVKSTERNISTIQLAVNYEMPIDSTTNESISDISSISIPSNSDGDIHNSRFTDSKDSASKRNIKAFRTIGLVIICYTVCWLPSWLLLFVAMFSKISIPNRFIFCVSWFAYLNSALNPVLYCCNRSVRMAVKSVIFPDPVTK